MVVQVRSIHLERDQQPAESEWWQHGLLHGRWHAQRYSVERASSGQCGGGSTASSTDKTSETAEKIMTDQPGCPDVTAPRQRG